MGHIDLPTGAIGGRGEHHPAEADRVADRSPHRDIATEIHREERALDEPDARSGSPLVRIGGIGGLAEGDQLHPLQQAMRDKHGLQCGYCTPGILMTMSAYLAEHPAPSEADVREALSGNLCRCTGYQHIVDAVLDAAEKMRG